MCELPFSWATTFGTPIKGLNIFNQLIALCFQLVPHLFTNSLSFFKNCCLFCVVYILCAVERCDTFVVNWQTIFVRIQKCVFGVVFRLIIDLLYSCGWLQPESIDYFLSVHSLVFTHSICMRVIGFDWAMAIQPNPKPLVQPLFVHFFSFLDLPSPINSL